MKTTIHERVSARLEGLVSRGIKAVEVSDEGHLVFTLTDNSTLDLGALSITTAHSVSYQEGTSGTSAPEGAWSETVPPVAQGNFLWTRVQTSYADGVTTTAYSVAKIGMDGAGSIVTVNGIAPDAGGNAQLSPTDIGAAAAEHGHEMSAVSGLSEALEGKAAAGHSHGQSDITGLAAALAEKQTALTAGDVTKTMLSANATNTSVTVTLPVASWASKAQTVSVAGMTADKVCIVAPAPASFADYCEAMVRATAQGNGTLEFVCEDLPTAALTVNVTMLT